LTSRTRLGELVSPNEFASLDVAQFTCRGGHPLQPDSFQPADELPAQRISPVPAVTGERSKPFNFKVLSDVSGLTEKYGRDKICTWKAIGA
jgi:hypothetical protein